jgi:hypothetical protein
MDPIIAYGRWTVAVKKKILSLYPQSNCTAAASSQQLKITALSESGPLELLNAD